MGAEQHEVPGPLYTSAMGRVPAGTPGVEVFVGSMTAVGGRLVGRASCVGSGVVEGVCWVGCWKSIVGIVCVGVGAVGIFSVGTSCVGTSSAIGLGDGAVEGVHCVSG